MVLPSRSMLAMADEHVCETRLFGLVTPECGRPHSDMRSIRVRIPGLVSQRKCIFALHVWWRCYMMLTLYSVSHWVIHRLAQAHSVRCSEAQPYTALKSKGAMIGKRKPFPYTMLCHRQPTVSRPHSKLLLQSHCQRPARRKWHPRPVAHLLVAPTTT